MKLIIRWRARAGRSHTAADVLTRNAPTVYAYPVGVNAIHSGVAKEWVMGG